MKLNPKEAIRQVARLYTLDLKDMTPKENAAAFLISSVFVLVVLQTASVIMQMAANAITSIK